MSGDDSHIPKDDGQGSARESGSVDRRQRRFRRSNDRILQQVEAFAASLEAIGDGVLLLDGLGQVVFASNHALRILETQRDYVLIKGDRLRFSDALAESKFQQLLQELAGELPTKAQGRALFLERRPPLLPLVLSVVQLPKHSHGDFSIACWMLVLRDLSCIPVPQWQLFTEHFKLSGAETRICLALADGLSLAEYSEKFHLSLHTARSQLKSVFIKTETRRQADLMRLIFSFTRL